MEKENYSKMGMEIWCVFEHCQAGEIIKSCENVTSKGNKNFDRDIVIPNKKKIIFPHVSVIFFPHLCSFQLFALKDWLFFSH